MVTNNQLVELVGLVRSVLLVVFELSVSNFGKHFFKSGTLNLGLRNSVFYKLNQYY